MKSKISVRHFLLIALLTVSFLGMASTAFAGNDGGGENGIDGRPLESYIVDITLQRSYTRKIDPVLNQLSKKIPQVAKNLRALVAKKVWYLVPVPLHTLPSKVIGTAFHTQQQAIQTKDAIWVDSLIFNHMHTDEYRATLIMHEMVMALRLSQLQAPYYCDNNGPVKCERVLSPEDYDQIRKLTNIFMTKLNQISTKRLIDLLFTKGFGDYRKESSSEKLPYVPSLEVLNEIFSANERAGELPTLDTLSSDGCTFVHKFNPSTQTFSLTVADQTDPYGLNMASGQTMSVSGTPNISILDGYITQVTLSDQVAAKVGTYRRIIHIELTTSGVIGIQLEWQVYDLNIATGKFAWETTSGDPNLYYGQSKSCVRPGKSVN